MMIAQHLYEGVEIGSEGSVGLITYMRTDSTRVGEAALSEVRGFITSNTARIICRRRQFTIARKRAPGRSRSDSPSDVTRTPDCAGASISSLRN
jgi:DNA topoisomerase-1